MSLPLQPLAALRREVRTYAERAIAPLTGEIDRSDRFPPEVFRGLAQEGLTGLGIPTEWGGIGGGTRELSVVLEELSRVSATVGTDLSVHLSVCAAPILQWGTDAQRARWLRPLARGESLGAFALTEPGVGSDAAHLSTRYERTGTGVRIVGSKMFITNGSSAGVVLAFATSDPARGSHGISAFLIPRGTPGFSVAQHLDKLGLRGSATNELVFDGVELPADAQLGREGEGLSIALGALMGGRIGIASCALGVAQAGFDQLRAAVGQRPDDGRRARLARAWADLSSARALIEKAAEAKDAGQPYELQASTAKLVAARVAASIAHDAVEVIGLPATLRGHPAERILRDARVFPIVEGTTEIQERIVGKMLSESGTGGTPSDHA